MWGAKFGKHLQGLFSCGVFFLLVSVNNAFIRDIFRPKNALFYAITHIYELNLSVLCSKIRIYLIWSLWSNLLTYKHTYLTFVCRGTASKAKKLTFLLQPVLSASASQPCETQDGSLSCIGGQAVSQPGNIWRPEEKDALPKVRGLSADGVRRVPLL